MNDNSNKTENIKPVRPTHPGQLRLIMLSLIILVAGIVIGSAGTTLIIQKNAAKLTGPIPGGPQRMTRKLKERLNLSDEQFAKIKPIIDKHMEKLQEIQESAHPLIVSEISEMKESISLLLTEDQKRLWQGQMMSLEGRFQRHRRMRRGGGGPHGPGGGRNGRPNRPGGGPYGPGRGPGRGMGPRGLEAGKDRPHGPGPGRDFRGGHVPPPHDQNSRD